MVVGIGLPLAIGTWIVHIRPRSLVQHLDFLIFPKHFLTSSFKECRDVLFETEVLSAQTCVLRLR